MKNLKFNTERNRLEADVYLSIVEAKNLINQKRAKRNINPDYTPELWSIKNRGFFFYFQYEKHEGNYVWIKYNVK